MSLTISSIPTDIWKQIGLEYFDIKDLLHMQRVCKKFYTLFRENCFWIPFYNKEAEEFHKYWPDVNRSPRFKHFYTKNFTSSEWVHGSVQQFWLEESLRIINNQISECKTSIKNAAEMIQRFPAYQDLNKRVLKEACSELEKLEPQQEELAEIYKNFLLPLESKLNLKQSRIASWFNCGERFLRKLELKSAALCNRVPDGENTTNLLILSYFVATIAGFAIIFSKDFH